MFKSLVSQNLSEHHWHFFIKDLQSQKELSVTYWNIPKTDENFNSKNYGDLMFIESANF